MKKQPLAYRMRPSNIDEVIGQQHLVGEGKIIRRMVDAGQLSSMILYGPPGVGKTSIAQAIAGSTDTHYKLLNAVVNNKKDMEIVVEEAKMSGQLILILDEVHRLDKGKQDFLLPHLEKGLLILIGATTANPFHSINPAIRSRCQIFELTPLTTDEIKVALTRALTDKTHGLGEEPVVISDEALAHFAFACGGDVRSALNGLELAVRSTQPNVKGEKEITLSVAEECIQRKSFHHDKDGDAHYDVLSAFQKSIRGSDVNAALHYLARLIEAGDLVSIGRRLLVIAYEDIGLANPQAGPRTLAAIEAAERLGFPEGRIPLANAVVELCLSPKSNSAYVALDAAIADIRKGHVGSVPAHLKDAHYKGAEQLGRGIGYKYPHDYERGWVKQQYLPDSLKSRAYYEPKRTGKFEDALADVYEKLRKSTFSKES
ncbi:replication-associated recombination protein A [Halalkalibacterium halodurans]|jgi:putative ATPase|uniref:Replication-associated recombination protein A n=1 Tax=Halalkalibacterium halodurans (strain ATCC BAA-125 / DSM 18197 / FERM 7344 / JCM 9153 / C-125) TaxID=272558 RepID=Q9KDF6_HALH5|nr:replication-associated recombination protein A [Halalkalibacterium halodurans]MDY7221782.1 replication-associated recombination protein A [Halalkalibacterium halodurans]MDY7241058.1 replication-associated recombination protein A [Halalkalibacterium halodurans]MED4081893.1 replication-associated recombination protein A [Halalkalibacterium halodurans]MED4086019.1 replication-associated recombination protein A [Halalkalibacterium halodurans]MED4106827.1 replication-associated recombination pro